MRWNSQVCERSLFYSLHLSLSLGNGLVEIKLEYLEQVYPLIYNHYLFSCYVGSRSCSADQFVGLWPCMEMWLFHLHLLEFWGIYNYICSCPSAPPPRLVKLYWLCPWLEIIYAKSRVVGYWIYSEEKLLGTPGAFSLLDIHVGSIMVTTFDPHMIWALHWEYSMITPSKGQLFFLIKFYMGTLWVQMYNTLVALLFVEVSHLPILCPFVLFRILSCYFIRSVLFLKVFMFVGAVGTYLMAFVIPPQLLFRYV